MALKFVSIGTAENVYVFDDGDTEYGLDTDGKVKIGTAPAINDEAVRLQDIVAPGDGVSAGATIDDHSIVRGDGGAKAVQDSGITIDDAGLLSFAASAGLMMGSCYGDHIGWSQAGAVQNTWYNISDAGMVSGVLRNVNHNGSGLLTVLEPGLWAIFYAITFEVNQANEHIDVGVEIDGSGSANAFGITHLETKFINSETHLSGFAPLILADNATIEIAISTKDPAPAPNITVDDLLIMAILIGGI